MFDEYLAQLIERGELEEAERVCDQNRDRFPVSSLVFLGSIRSKQNKPGEAANFFGRALNIDPNSIMALNNRGVAMQRLNKPGQAITYFKRVLELCPGHPEPTFNLALAELLAGDFENGLRHYEDRGWKLKQDPKRFDPAKRWDGTQSLAGKTILLYAEQGMGDTIQFVRYVARLRDESGGCKVVLEAQKPLLPLLARMPGVVAVREQGDRVPAYDFQCALMSLPYLLGTRESTIPADIPYIQAGLDVVKRWQPMFHTKKMKVGLVWAGNPHHVNDLNRSMKLAELAPLLAQDKAFFSLQVSNSRRDDTSQLRNVGSRFKDFADTAAAISLLDLVITVDTSVAHLAGAIGKQTWLMLPYSPDWRWMLNRSDSTWYPSMTLFRQTSHGDWSEVIDRVASYLAAFSVS